MYDIWAQHGTEAPFKVNARRTSAFGGGIDGKRLVFQQIRGGYLSDIRLFDLETRRRSSALVGVNTRRWEWAPTISGDWVLFARGMAFSKSTQRIFLQNLVTGEQRVLDSLRQRYGVLEPGQVNGNYAVWSKCSSPAPECDVYLYDIAAHTTTPMPQTGHTLSSASVTPSGTTYYRRNIQRECGGNVELVKTTLDGETIVLHTLGAGEDIFSTYAVAIASRPPLQGETTRIYFTRAICSIPGPRFDIYSLDDTERVPPP